MKKSKNIVILRRDIRDSIASQEVSDGSSFTINILIEMIRRLKDGKPPIDENGLSSTEVSLGDLVFSGGSSSSKRINISYNFVQHRFNLYLYYGDALVSVPCIDKKSFLDMDSALCSDTEIWNAFIDFAKYIFVETTVSEVIAGRFSLDGVNGGKTSVRSILEGVFAIPENDIKDFLSTLSNSADCADRLYAALSKGKELSGKQLCELKKLVSDLKKLRDNFPSE